MNIRPKASLNGRTGTGLLKGEPGDNGATFTPILDEEGNLSWSNDKGLPNPEPVNIRGPKGDPCEGVSWNDLKDRPDEYDAVEIVTEMGFVEPIVAADGSIYTDENGDVYML